jgi:hypothetical protein
VPTEKPASVPDRLNTTWTALRSNLGLRFGKPATNNISQRFSNYGALVVLQKRQKKK